MDRKLNNEEAVIAPFCFFFFAPFRKSRGWIFDNLHRTLESKWRNVSNNDLWLVEKLKCVRLEIDRAPKDW